MDHPDNQRRGLALIRWWPAGLPHYIIVGVFLGGTAGRLGRVDRRRTLSECSLIVLLVRGTYP